MNKITLTLILAIISLMATSCGNTVAPDPQLKAKAKLQPAFYGPYTQSWVADKAQPIVIREVDTMVEPGDVISIAGHGYIVVTIDRPYDDYTNEHLRAYQIELLDDSVKLYDGNRVIYAYKTDWKHGMDSAMLKDNE